MIKGSDARRNLGNSGFAFCIYSFFLFLAFTFPASHLTAQTKAEDSLLNEVKKWQGKVGITADTSLLNAYFQLGSSFRDENWDTAIYFFNQCISKANKVNNLIKMAESQSQIGWCYYSKGNLTEAERILKKSNDIAKTLVKNERLQKKALKLQSTNLVFLGKILETHGNYSKALDNFFKALKIDEQLNSRAYEAYDLNTIGGVYRQLGDCQKALTYYLKAAKFDEAIGRIKGLTSDFGNIGNAYSCLGNFDRALLYYFKALKLSENINEFASRATYLGNIGVAYQSKGDHEKALKYFFEALKINEQFGDKTGQAINCANIGSLYLKMNKYSMAETYVLKAISIDSAFDDLVGLKEDYAILTEIYTNNHKPLKALESYKKHIGCRDSLESQENKKASVQKEMQYEFDKKQTADSLKVAKEKYVADLILKEEKRTNRLRLILGSVVLLLVIVFAGFMYNRFKVTQKQKLVIEQKEKIAMEQNILISQQKHLIEERHKEITDSINYAERIQRSFLATETHLQQNLHDYFILFKPKDVVSGDFYWSATLLNETFALAAADSTGHGVPGAIMSLLNITSLEKAIETNVLPHDILNETRKTIIERLRKDGSTEGGKDGMDCSLLCFDFKRMKLLVATANNPVWIVRKTILDESHSEPIQPSLIEIAPDKMPVGKHDLQNTPFTLHEVELKKGDMVYAFTDGFQDQFGGDRGKKFMVKKLRELVMANSHLPSAQQKKVLEEAFLKWVGNLEQVDDVTLLGVRV